MKLSDYTKADLEAMSYDDIAFMILTESGKQLKINELFKKVCDVLELSESSYIDKLPAFFDVLSGDHRFIMLENGLWDLRTKHSTKVVIETEDEDLDEIEEETPLEDAELEEDKNIFIDDDDDIEDNDDDLKDLIIIDEDEEANGI